MHRSRTRVTIDRDEIVRWVEARGGAPVHERDETGRDRLRIEYPAPGEQTPLGPLTWDEFFMRFEGEELAFSYPEDPEDPRAGERAKLIPRRRARPSPPRSRRAA